MSLSAVLLIHISSLGGVSQTPRNDNDNDNDNEQRDEKDEDEDDEYYHLLELPKYASLPEIRKAFRHVSQRLACERMNLSLEQQQHHHERQQLQHHEREDEENDDEEYQKNLQKMINEIDNKQQKVKHAYSILGDSHLRQQYHLLSCKPIKYRVIHNGPLQFIQNWTRPGRWMPLLVLQSVLIAALVNATTAQLQTQASSAWVWVLMPFWFYYGTVVLFWLVMMEPLPLPTILLPAVVPAVPSSSSSSFCSKCSKFWQSTTCSNSTGSASQRRRRRRVVTLHGWWTMFCNFAQHASLWLGIFFMARQWDSNAAMVAINNSMQLVVVVDNGDVEEIISISNNNNNNTDNMQQHPSWYILSIPFYLAIFFRCYCTMVAVASLRHVQSKMVSPRQKQQIMEQQQQQQTQTPGPADQISDNATTTTSLLLPEGYIVVTSKNNEKEQRLAKSANDVSIHSTNDNNNDNNNNSNENNNDEYNVRTSPEYRQVDQTVLVLKRAAIQLAILGCAFIALVSLKVDNDPNHGNIFENVSFWVVFIPIWLHIACRIMFSLHCRSPRYQQQPHSTTAAVTATTVSPAGAGTGATTTAASPRSTSSRQHNKSSTITSSKNASVSVTPRSVRFAIDMDDAKDDTRSGIEEADDTPQSIMGVATRSLGVGESNSVGIELAPALTYVRYQKEGGLTSSRNSIEKEADEMDQKPAASSLFSIVQEDQMAEPQEFDNDAADVATSESSKEPEQSQLFDVETGLSTDGMSIEQYQEDAESVDQSEQTEFFDAVEESPDETTTVAKNTTSLSGRTKFEKTNEHHDEDAAENQSTPEEDTHVHQEFEQWQSVYENAEVRTAPLLCPIPCSVYFQIMICCLVVAKLNVAYGNDDPENAGFSAFLIIFIPFWFALLICCFTFVVAFCCHMADGLNARARRETTDIGNSPTGESPQITNVNGTESDGSLDEAPMQAGPGLYQRMSFSTHIDIARNDFDLQQCSQVFAMALDVPPEDAKEWLLLHGNQKQLTFWEQIMTFADDVDCQSVNNDEQCFEGLKSMDQEWLVLLRINLQAHFDRSKFQDELDAIAPLHGDGADVVGFDEELGRSSEVAGIECLVCCEVYKMADTVHCEGDPIHFFCRQCFHRYVTETVDSGDIAGLPCADVDCNSTFATPVVRENLSAWEVLRMQDRETDRNTRVALAAKAVLKCPCGTIGIVSDTDIGDGCITCPGSGCGLQYCALCGNKWHPDTDCPPTKKMLQWVVKNTMPCPNCHTPLVKNGGCDHMHCAPPAGCGHHFSYSTGKPMTPSGRTLRGLYNT